MQDAFVILDLVKSVAIPSTGGMSVRVTKTVLASKGKQNLEEFGTNKLKI